MPHMFLSILIGWLVFNSQSELNLNINLFNYKFVIYDKMAYKLQRKYFNGTGPG